MTIQTYLVGGAVRDGLLGRPIGECDYVVVGATSDKLTALNFRQVGADFPVFLHPTTHDEYALARTERKNGKGYKGFEVIADSSVSLAEDLSRRDLTINAMAIEVNGLFDSNFKQGTLTKDTVIDPYGGLDDLANRRLRHVSHAFCEDPVRVLRLARFYARYAPLGFDIASETITLVQKMRDDGELGFLVAERVWAETHKALQEACAISYFDSLDDMGVLGTIMPTLACAIGYAKQSGHWQIIAQSLSLAHHMADNDKAIRFKFALLALCFLKIDKIQMDNTKSTHSHFGDNNFQSFCQQLKIPKHYHSFAFALLTHFKTLMAFDTLIHDTANATALFELIKQTAFLKSTDLLNDLLACISLYKLAKQQIKLQTIHQTLAPISQQHIDQSLTGKDIGLAIDQLRLTQLANLLQT